MLLVFTCVFQVKWKDDTCYMVAGRRGVFLRQTECRFLWCGGKEKDVEGRRADRWRDAGNNDLFLPTRQPWVLLHGWSECNKPWFFRLTAGACEHTSSPLWERRMSRQSPCLRLFLFLLLSLPVSQQSLSDAVLVSVLCVFSLSACDKGGHSFFCLVLEEKHLGVQWKVYKQKAKVIQILVLKPEVEIQPNPSAFADFS